MVYMYHSFLVHSSADGHLGCFHVLAMTNSAAFFFLKELRSHLFRILLCRTGNTSVQKVNDFLKSSSGCHKGLNQYQLWFFLSTFSVLFLMSVLICPVPIDVLADFNMCVTVIKDFCRCKLSHF